MFPYFLILVHCLILMVGGHYTYAEVPLVDSFKTLFGFTRNNYDKVGHFAQGFIPAMIAWGNCSSAKRWSTAGAG